MTYYHYYYYKQYFTWCDIFHTSLSWWFLIRVSVKSNLYWFSRSFFSILSDLNNAGVCMVSILPLIFNTDTLSSKILWTFPEISTIIIVLSPSPSCSTAFSISSMVQGFFLSFTFFHLQSVVLFFLLFYLFHLEHATFFNAKFHSYILAVFSYCLYQGF